MITLGKVKPLFPVTLPIFVQVKPINSGSFCCARVGNGTGLRRGHIEVERQGMGGGGMDGGVGGNGWGIVRHGGHFGTF